MAARKKSSSLNSKLASNTFFTKDLFIFILIMAIVAFVTYVLTYNAITSKVNQQIGASYDVPIQEDQQLPSFTE